MPHYFSSAAAVIHSRLSQTPAHLPFHLLISTTSYLRTTYSVIQSLIHSITHSFTHFYNSYFRHIHTLLWIYSRWRHTSCLSSVSCNTHTYTRFPPSRPQILYCQLLPETYSGTSLDRPAAQASLHNYARSEIVEALDAKGALAGWDRF